MRSILSLFLGIVLIVAGTAVLTYQGITVTTAQRQLLQVGPLQAGTEQANWTITLPPVLGAILLAGGTIVVFLIAIVMRVPRKEPDAEGASQESKRIKRREPAA
jgi:ABC-type Fe3+-siderophore transport system permease subunit